MRSKHEQLAVDVLQEFSESIESPNKLRNFYFTINRLRFNTVPRLIWIKIWNWKDLFMGELKGIDKKITEKTLSDLYDLKEKLRTILEELISLEKASENKSFSI